MHAEEFSSRMVVDEDEFGWPNLTLNGSFYPYQSFRERTSRASTKEDNVNDDSHPLSNMNLYFSSFLDKNVHSFSGSTSTSSHQMGLICFRNDEERAKKLWPEEEERITKEEEDKTMISRLDFKGNENANYFTKNWPSD